MITRSNMYKQAIAHEAAKAGYEPYTANTKRRCLKCTHRETETARSGNGRWQYFCLELASNVNPGGTCSRFCGKQTELVNRIWWWVFGPR